MKDKVGVEGSKDSLLSNPDLAEQMAELRRLRDQVRLAEMRTYQA
jgi:hypothetical protein